MILFSCQQLLHVVILIVTNRAQTEVCKPYKESQQSQGGQKADVLPSHDLEEREDIQL